MFFIRTILGGLLTVLAVLVGLVIAGWILIPLAIFLSL